MGEMPCEKGALVKAVDTVIAEHSSRGDELRVTTAGGRFQIRWDENGSASALGQLAFFAEFLEVSGLFERWTESCPMAYTCLLYTSDAADERSSVDLGGRRIIKKKKEREIRGTCCVQDYKSM